MDQKELADIIKADLLKFAKKVDKKVETKSDSDEEEGAGNTPKESSKQGNLTQPSQDDQNLLVFYKINSGLFRSLWDVCTRFI